MLQVDKSFTTWSRQTLLQQLSLLDNMVNLRRLYLYWLDEYRNFPDNIRLPQVQQLHLDFRHARDWDAKDVPRRFQKAQPSGTSSSPYAPFDLGRAHLCLYPLPYIFGHAMTVTLAGFPGSVLQSPSLQAIILANRKMQKANNSAHPYFESLRGWQLLGQELQRWFEKQKITLCQKVVGQVRGTWLKVDTRFEGESATGLHLTVLDANKLTLQGLGYLNTSAYSNLTALTISIRTLGEHVIRSFIDRNSNSASCDSLQRLRLTSRDDSAEYLLFSAALATENPLPEAVELAQQFRNIRLLEVETAPIIFPFPRGPLHAPDQLTAEQHNAVFTSCQMLDEARLAPKELKMVDRVFPPHSAYPGNLTAFIPAAVFNDVVHLATTKASFSQRSGQLSQDQIIQRARKALKSQWFDNMSPAFRTFKTLPNAGVVIRVHLAAGTPSKRFAADVQEPDYLGFFEVRPRVVDAAFPVQRWRHVDDLQGFHSVRDSFGRCFP